jgi:hypothetical protein
MRGTLQRTHGTPHGLFRRAQREEEVSEDEGYEVESEAGDSVNRDTYSVGSLSLSSLSLSDPSHMCACAETTRSPSQHELDSLDTALSLCTRKSTKFYPRSPYDLNVTSADWSVNKIVPRMHTPPLHASDHITILSQSREALPSSNKLLTFRSPAHGNSIVHMYPIQFVLNNSTPNIGAVLDTGAQRSAAKNPEEILRHTNSSHTMQGDFGKSTTMKGILMGCSTVDI